MIKLKKFTFNLFAENTYVVWDDQTLDAAVIDPGTSDSEEEDELDRFIEDKKLLVKYLINTHCHIDHILGCRFVYKKYGVPYYIPEKDLPLLENAQLQAKEFNIDMTNPPKPDNYLTEDLDLKLGNSNLKFLFTPGHTPGEYCIYFETDKICITGDVLFKEGIGRTDLWGGDYDELILSIKTKLFSLPNDVKIYPGHGEPSTIGHEKANNPFLN